MQKRLQDCYVSYDIIFFIFRDKKRNTLLNTNNMLKQPYIELFYKFRGLFYRMGNWFFQAVVKKK